MISNELLIGLGISKAHILQTYIGGNSEVSHVRIDNSEFAIKQYKGDTDRKARSLLYESSALKFISETKLFECPELISISHKDFAIAYKWIPGTISTDSQAAKNYILNTINKLSISDTLIKSYHLNAIDSVHKPLDLLEQLRNRLSNISIIQNIPINLISLINSELNLVSNTLTSSSNFEFKTLSLSDFGTHNLIQKNRNEFIHIDFEFFGVDSKAKLFSDLFVHPRNTFSSSELRESLNKIEGNSRLESEIMNLLPGIAIKWSFIVLRRFIDWDSCLYKEESSNSVRPEQYLDYANFLRNLDSIDEVITFKEFTYL